jgi:hypothetical protein
MTVNSILMPKIVIIIVQWEAPRTDFSLAFFGEDALDKNSFFLRKKHEN